MRSELNLSQPIPEGYEEHYRLTHQEMIPFVQTQLRKFRNPLVLFFWLINILILACIFPLIEYNRLPVSKVVIGISCGIACFFLLIPIHELIHGIAYRLSGAKHVSYHAVPRKLMFYALADRFVAGYSIFMRVAFSPFLIITGGLIILQQLLPSDWSWFCWGMLFMHTSGCAGDFALASYFYENRQFAPLTYDIKNEGVTVFLRKNSA